MGVRRRTSGLQHDLDAAVFLVAEGLVGFRHFVERDPVRDDEGRIDLALLDFLEERFEVAMYVRLPHLHRQPFVLKHRRRRRRSLTRDVRQLISFMQPARTQPIESNAASDRH